MAKISLYLDTRRPYQAANDDQTELYPVKISVFINGKGRILTNTGIAVPKENWKNDRIVGLPLKDTYNNALRFRLLKIEDELLRLGRGDELQKTTLKELREYITHIAQNTTVEPAEEQPPYTIARAFEEFISGKDRAGTASIYRQSLAKLRRYYNPDTLRFEDISLAWLRDYEERMRKDGLSVNAISVHLRNLRSIFNRAIDDEVIDQNCYPFRKFTIKTERTAKRSLTGDQLRTLRYYEFQEQQAHLAKYRDLFMLIFYLLGINMVDLLHLKEIKDGRVEFRRAKTGRLYSIKVEPEAMEIIERYKGEEYLLDVLDHYGNYKDFLLRMNRNLQQIGPMEWVANAAADPAYVKRNKKKITPLFPELTTYWARHTWATMASQCNVPKETIAAALGHGGHSVTDIYIDFDQRKVDQANRRVIDRCFVASPWPREE